MDALQAGAATANITPWLGVTIPGSVRARHAEDVDDELLAKALVLDNGHTRLAFITCDLIGMPQNIADRARQRVARRCGIPIENTMINATHTHSGGGIADLLGTDGDGDYIEWLHLKIADAAELACRRLRPARIGFASVQEDRIAFNRRWRMKDGTVRMNPGIANPDLIEPAGPTDPQLAMFYMEDLDGDPLSAVACYSLHYIGAGSGISADYFGHFFRLMRRYLGGDCVPLLWNAASGQINNIDFSGRRRWKDRGHAHAKKMANVLAGHMLTEIQLMEMQDTLELRAATGTFDFSPRTITPEDLEMAEKILASPDNPPEYDQGPFSWVVGQPIPRSIVDVYAMECRRLANLPSRMNAAVQVFRLGDAAIVALPGEVFVESGLNIKSRASAAPVFIVSLANGYIGYICTDEALTREGGYETWAANSSLGGVGTAPAMENLAGDLLARLFP